MKFEVYKTQKHQHAFRIVADNGEIVATSESYKNRSDCLATVRLIMLSARHVAVIDADTGETVYGAFASLEQIERAIMESGLDG